MARRELAPAGATTIELCRYSGLNATPRLTLVRSRLLRAPSLVRELLGEFNRLPSPGSGVFHCPQDDASQIVAALGYPSGREVTISVELTGCRLVTNGSVRRSAAAIGAPRPFGPRLVGQLERLVAA